MERPRFNTWLYPLINDDEDERLNITHEICDQTKVTTPDLAFSVREIYEHFRTGKLTGLPEMQFQGDDDIDTELPPDERPNCDLSDFDNYAQEFARKMAYRQVVAPQPKPVQQPQSDPDPAPID